jgi:hypothetical protein
MVSRLFLARSFGALHHDDKSEWIDQAHRLLPKDQPLLAWLAQVLDDP